jgi:hypothetical protein
MDEKLIKDAQYRKGLSIAFFNATNNATEIVKLEGVANPKDLTNRITFYRDWLLDEHKKYYTTVIANVGLPFDINKTIERLNQTKNMEELKSLWIALSQDERDNVEILKVKDQLKQTYENI